MISFDHDLADEHYNDYLSDANFELPDDQIELNYEEYKEKTGYDAAKWLVGYVMENELPICYCKVHSQNTVGAENILKYLNNYSRIHENYECCKIVQNEIKTPY